MIYRWKTPFPGRGVTAQVVGDRLEEIRQSRGLTAKAVVDDARPPASPLHPCFEWNDAEAAEKWREEQARKIIQNIEVVIEDQKGKGHDVRAFVHISDADDPQYTSIEVAMKDPGLRRNVLDTALRELVAWREKYSALKELAELLSAVDQTLVKFGT